MAEYALPQGATFPHVLQQLEEYAEKLIKFVEATPDQRKYLRALARKRVVLWLGADTESRVARIEAMMAHTYDKPARLHTYISKQEADALIQQLKVLPKDMRVFL